jgi:hypothetical protein
MTIRFLLRYMSRPLHFFGRLGVINMGFGSTIALWLLTWKLVTGTDVVQQHGLLLVFAAVLILVGSNWWRLDFSGVGSVAVLQSIRTETLRSVGGT